MKTKLTISDVELTYKKTEMPTIRITESLLAASLSRKTIPENQIAHREFFGVLLLNRSNLVLHQSIVSMGGLTSTIIDPKHILQYVLLSNAAGLILFHNHPSGEVRPSEQDIRLTKRIKEACNIIDVSLLDHIILSGYRDALPNFFSFADEGII